MDGHATTASSPKMTPERKNNRRKDILDAAAGRFRYQGYAATTMRDIAHDSGMLAGSRYYHFPSKSGLLLAVHQDCVRRIAGAVDAAIGERDAQKMQTLAEKLLKSDDTITISRKKYLVAVSMLANLAQGQKQRALAIVDNYSQGLFVDKPITLMFHFLIENSKAS